MAPLRITFFDGLLHLLDPTTAAHDGLLQGVRSAAGDDFMFEGLPARRWKTFWLDSTPIDDVRDSSVPLFIAQGTRDDTTLPADLFALETIRQQPNRPIRYAVLEQGNHAFETPDGRSHLAELFDDFVRMGARRKPADWPFGSEVARTRSR